MEKRRVVITGLGTVNPLGNNTADSWAAAKAGKCGIGPITQFDTTDFKCKLAGEVKGFDPDTIVDKKEARKMARFTVLALAAAAEAVTDSGLDTEAEAKQIGVILSSGIGGLPTIEEQHTRGEEKGMEKVSPYFVPMSIANMAAAQVAIRFGLKGMCTCPVTACAGGTNAVGDAFHRIRDGYETAMVCGGAESCISPLGIGGFTSMKALSTASDPDAASLPFDARRGGFVMGEGSGVLVPSSLQRRSGMRSSRQVFAISRSFSAPSKITQPFCCCFDKYVGKSSFPIGTNGYPRSLAYIAAKAAIFLPDSAAMTTLSRLASILSRCSDICLRHFIIDKGVPPTPQKNQPFSQVLSSHSWHFK